MREQLLQSPMIKASRRSVETLLLLAVGESAPPQTQIVGFP